MTDSLFLGYKKGESFIHKAPPHIKILCVPILSIIHILVPPAVSLAILAIQTIVFFAIGFKVKDLLSDMRPVLYYAVLLVFFNAVSFAFSRTWDMDISTLFVLIRLFAMMQCASILFRSSTVLQLREGIARLFGANSSITSAISMLLAFIPMLSRIYNQSQKAYLARGGKKGIAMALKLLPILFSVGMKKAYNMAKAITIRQ